MAAPLAGHGNTCNSVAGQRRLLCLCPAPGAVYRTPVEAIQNAALLAALYLEGSIRIDNPLVHFAPAGNMAKVGRGPWIGRDSSVCVGGRSGQGALGQCGAPACRAGAPCFHEERPRPRPGRMGPQAPRDASIWGKGIKEEEPVQGRGGRNACRGLKENGGGGEPVLGEECG
jgi:hypothetical protein